LVKKKYPGNCPKDFECPQWRFLFCSLRSVLSSGKGINATGTLEEDT